MDRSFEVISRSLGRSTPPATIPDPPRIDDASVRLSAIDGDLVATFLANAAAAKMKVYTTTLAELPSRIVEVLGSQVCKSAVLTRSPLLDGAGVGDALRRAGLTVHHWDKSTLDAVYDVDVGITDAYAAVAETGSVVVRSSASHGRAVSLVPPVHVAVLERSQIVPDLIDLFAKLAADGTGSGVVIITGPSKTADIEMNLVVGVHGPGEVHVFVVEGCPETSRDREGAI